VSEHHQPIFFQRGAGEAGGVTLDDQQGDAAEAGGPVRTATVTRRPHARGDEHLGAVDDVVVAVAARGGLEVGDVGAAGGLGDGERGDLAAGEDVGDEAVLLGLAAEVEDRREADAVAEQAGDEAAGAGARELLARGG
jgi:hypothetical protein